MHDLNLEADTYLSEMHEKSNEIPPIQNECVREPLNGVISFKIPQVIKGPKKTRIKNVVEQNTENKKKKGAQKGERLEHNDLQTRDEPAEPNQIIDFNVGASSAMDAAFVQGGYANSTMPHFNYFANPLQWLLHTNQEDTQVF